MRLADHAEFLWFMALLVLCLLLSLSLGCVPVARPQPDDVQCGQVGRVHVVLRAGTPLSCADARGPVIQALQCGGGKCYREPLRLDRDWWLFYTPGYCGLLADGPTDGATYADGRMCASLRAADLDQVVLHEIGHALCLAYSVNQEACRVHQAP